jgi:hypothetical protein
VITRMEENHAKYRHLSERASQVRSRVIDPVSARLLRPAGFAVRTSSCRLLCSSDAPPIGAVDSLAQCRVAQFELRPLLH